MAQGERELAGAGSDSPNKQEAPPEAVEVSPVVFFDKDFRARTNTEEDAALYDFRPVAVPADTPESAPKASSAQESVPSSDSANSESTETPAPVEKDSGKNKASESGTPGSSSKTSAGKSEQTVGT